MRKYLITLLGSLLTGAYWWVVFTIIYADVLFAGDRDPAVPPSSEKAALLHAAITILIALIAYAALTLLWARIVARRRS